MNFNEYQQLAMRTASKRETVEKGQFVAALGIAGEAAETLEAVLDRVEELHFLHVDGTRLMVKSGKFADYMKKVLSHGHPADKVRVKKELGDMLWYIARMSVLFDLTMDEVAQGNVDKLKERYPDGFKSELSQNRKPEDG